MMGAMDMLGIAVTKEEVTAMVMEYDSDGSGQIELDEFMMVRAHCHLFFAARCRTEAEAGYGRVKVEGGGVAPWIRHSNVGSAQSASAWLTQDACGGGWGSDDGVVHGLKKRRLQRRRGFRAQGGHEELLPGAATP